MCPLGFRLDYIKVPIQVLECLKLDLENSKLSLHLGTSQLRLSLLEMTRTSRLLMTCVVLAATGMFGRCYHMCPFDLSFAPAPHKQTASAICCIFAAGALVAAHDLPRTSSRYPRSLLQTSASGPSAAPSTIDVTELSATDAIALLCSRNITSVAYVQALFEHYDNGGFECLNSFITLDREQASVLSLLLPCFLHRMHPC